MGWVTGVHPTEASDPLAPNTIESGPLRGCPHALSTTWIRQRLSTSTPIYI